MINKLTVNISISRQCKLLGISRSAYYHASIKDDTESIELKRKIDEIYLKHPFKGSNIIVEDLKAQGIDIGRYKVRRLMREMCIEATCPKKRIIYKKEGHKVYPYLLDNLDINK